MTGPAGLLFSLMEVEPVAPHDLPLYTLADVARYVGLARPRVARWLQGYGYKLRSRSGTRRRQPPVSGAAAGGVASFLDLIETRMVARLIERGFTLQLTRRIAAEARKRLNTSHPFTLQRFYTLGRKAYYEIVDATGQRALVEALHGGQRTLPSVIEAVAEELVFEDDRPSEWWPLGRATPVVLSPRTSFGRPTIAHTRVPTEIVADFVAAESDEAAACRWFNVAPAQVSAALAFERRPAA